MAERIIYHIDVNSDFLSWEAVFRIHFLSAKTDLRLKLPVRDLFFVGAASEKKLFNLGIHTIEELAKADSKILRHHLKSHGITIWNFANGREFSIIEKEAVPNKGYGNSTTISFDVTDAATAKIVLLGLAETLGRRLRKDEVKIQCVQP